MFLLLSFSIARQNTAHVFPLALVVDTYIGDDRDTVVLVRLHQFGHPSVVVVHCSRKASFFFYGVK